MLDASRHTHARDPTHDALPLGERREGADARLSPASRPRGLVERNGAPAPVTDDRQVRQCRGERDLCRFRGRTGLRRVSRAARDEKVHPGQPMGSLVSSPPRPRCACFLRIDKLDSARSQARMPVHLLSSVSKGQRWGIASVGKAQDPEWLHSRAAGSPGISRQVALAGAQARPYSGSRSPFSPGAVLRWSTAEKTFEGLRGPPAAPSARSSCAAPRWGSPPGRWCRRPRPSTGACASAATCSGSPIPPSGTCASSSGNRRGSISSCTIGVRIQPGAIAFTRIPAPAPPAPRCA